MRVLHVDTERTWRGGEQQMLYLAAGLRNRGIPTAVACQPGSPCAERVRKAGLGCREVPMGGEWDLVAAQRIARIARAGRFDVVHAHTSHAHSLALLAAKFFGGAPIMVAHRRVDFHIRPGLFSIGAAKYRLGVDRIIAISRAVRDVLVSDGVPQENITVIPSAVDLGRFEGITRKAALRAELGVPDDAVLIGNVGYLVGHKAHEYLIRAAPLVLDEIPNAYFLIAGSGPRLRELKSEAEGQGVSSRVLFAGFRPDVPHLLLEFDVFALSSWGEGLCSTLLEAMAMRCPIVATSAGGVPEVILDGETGILVRPRDPEALARGIVSMVQRPELAKQMAENAHRRVREKFSSDALVEQTLRLYEELLRGKGRSAI